MLLKMENKKKKGIPTTKLVIDITGVELTEEQKDLVMNDMAARLHGYRTEPLLFLHGADITLSRTVKNSDLVTKLTKSITDVDICKCEKPWGVSGMCIVCEKPIKID